MDTSAQVLLVVLGGLAVSIEAGLFMVRWSGSVHERNPGDNAIQDQGPAHGAQRMPSFF